MGMGVQRPDSYSFFTRCHTEQGCARRRHSDHPSRRGTLQQSQRCPFPRTCQPTLPGGLFFSGIETRLQGGTQMFDQRAHGPRHLRAEGSQRIDRIAEEADRPPVGQHLAQPTGLHRRGRAEVGQQREPQASQHCVAQHLGVVGPQQARHGDAGPLRLAAAAPGRGLLEGPQRRPAAQIGQAIVPRQLVGMAGRAAPPQVGRRGQQQRARRAQLPRHVAVGRRTGVAHREVEALVREVDQPVRQVEFDADAGPGAQKALELWTDMLAPQRDRRRHPHQALRLRGQVAHAEQALLDLRKAGGGLVDQLLAGLGEPHAARRTLQQRHADRTLEFGDALADRCLRQAEPLRGERETAALRDRAEGMHVGPQRRVGGRAHALIVHPNEQCSHAM
ncbi:hypothetical protein X551_03080 [Methylibium sp. T29]|nr:hypothetical protein X551_03080 [Methylibium sp. T29]